MCVCVCVCVGTLGREISTNGVSKSSCLYLRSIPEREKKGQLKILCFQGEFKNNA